MLAAAAVAPVVALDLLYAQRSLGPEKAEYTPTSTYLPLPSPRAFVRYSDTVESIPADEAETVDAILASLHRLHERTHAKYGEAVRVSHAKAHGIAVGELTVADDLPEPLAQGLFKPGKRYPVIARLANVPGELDSDAVGTQRGLALKVLDVEGEKLQGHTEATQDFVLDSGNRFAVGTAAQFLMNHRMLEHAPQIPDALKAMVSSVSRAGNKVLHRVGADSSTLDFFGHSRVHPMAEAYFTQAPMRYGSYVAKIAVVPVAPTQRGLARKAIDHDDPDALRTATVSYLRDNDAEFEIRVQLCTDLDTMPVEDASVEWPEEQSPYRTVARLRLPRQEAYSEARREFVDNLSFSVSHCLADHRPLGSVQRARLRAYPEMARLRRETNGVAVREPVSIDEVPA
ncbi:catalase family protein [Aureimonas leprariae]|uniref:Catalase family protein n=2 Tax=Plantimonas leprariae TaxID=2615207 RepID=A0A7V7PKD7_9HYPH|nr:catalase family protein [Aureimonas leprariae]